MAIKDLLIKIGVKGSQKAEQSVKKVDKSFDTLGKSALKVGAAFYAAKGLVNGLGTIIELSGRQEKAEAKLNAVLKSTAGVAGLTSKELTNMASSLQEVTTFGDEAIIEAQSLLLTFTKVGEDVFPQATETILNMSEAMGTDLKSSTVQLGKALNDPVKGISALSRVGVQLTDIQIEQIKAFSELGDMASAQKVILGELETQFGGLARATSETMAGSLEQMNNAIGDAAEALGDLLGPTIVKIAKGFKTAAEVVGSFFKRMNPPDFDSMIENLKSVNAEVGLIADMQRLKITTELMELNTELRSLGEEETTLEDVSKRTKKSTGDLADQMVRLAKFTAEGNTATVGFINNSVIPMIQEQAKEVTQVGELITRREKLIKALELMDEKEKQSVETKKEATNTTENLKTATVNLISAFESELVIRKDLAAFKIEEIETEKMTDAERLSAKEEFNSAMLGMFNSDFDMRRVLMSQQAQRFKDAGVEEVQIARFTAEQKKQIAADELSFKLGTISGLTGALGKLNTESKGSALVSKRLAQATALIDTYAGANKALAASPTPFNFIAAAAVVAAGLANVANIESQKFAKGGIVPGTGQGDIVPAMLTPGELILNQAQQENLAGGLGTITINFNGPITNDEYVKDFILPEIEKTISQGLA